MKTNKTNLTIWLVIILAYFLILFLWWLFCTVFHLLPTWICPSCMTTWSIFDRTFWCCLLGFLLIGALPFVIQEHVREVVVNAETVNYLIEKDKLRKFHKFHIVDSELKKVKLEKILKKAGIVDAKGELVCAINEKDCRKFQYVEHKLTLEREKEAQRMVKEYKVSLEDARTAMLSEQIEIEIFAPEKKKNDKKTNKNK